MVKKIISLLCIVALGAADTSVCFSQEESKQFIRKGLIRSQATICPGIMLKENISTISLHGTLEYYVADNVSLRGDTYFYLQGKDAYGNNPFQINHATFSGLSYHFRTKSHFDPYFTIAPGVTVTQDNSFEACLNSLGPNVTVSFCKQTEKSVNPLLSAGFGFNYYFQKWFHLFGEARYIGGKYLSDAPAPLSLSELRFSFGLGFNLNLLKKK